MKETRPLIPIAVLLLFIASLGAYALFNQEEEELIISYLFPPDWSHARSLDELVARATDIVRVEILPDVLYEDVDLAWRPTPEERARHFPEGNPGRYVTEVPPSYLLFTMNHVKVTEVFKGNLLLSDIIDIAQLGGRRGNVMFVMRDRIDLESGDDLVLFLLQTSRAHRENIFALSAQFQSVYRFPASSGESGVATFDLNEELELEGVVESGRPLNPTIGDLKRIAYESFGSVPE